MSGSSEFSSSCKSCQTFKVRTLHFIHPLILTFYENKSEWKNNKKIKSFQGLTNFKQRMALDVSNLDELTEIICFICTEADFKEFERRFKFKPRFKYGCFH